MCLLSFWKNQIHFLIVYSCFLSHAYAQDSITTGVPYAVIDGYYKTYFEKGGNLLAVKVEGKRIFIQLFNSSTLKLIKKTHLDLSGNQVLERVTEISGSFFIFYSVQNKKEHNVHLFCKEINMESAGVLEERFVLKSECPLQTIQSLNAEAAGLQINEKDRDKVPVFNFDYSLDKKKFCVHYRCANEHSNVMGIQILDNNLAVISAKEVDVPYTTPNMLMLDHAVDQAGTLYVALNVYDDRVPLFKRTIRSDSPYRTSVLIFPVNSRAVTVADIELGDRQVSRLRFVDTDNGNLNVIGFYHVGKTAVCIKGIFNFSINDNTFRLDKVTTHDIPDEILNPYLNSKRGDTSSYTFYFEDLVLKKVISQKDNSILLIGEHVYDIEKTKSYPEEQLQIDFNHHYNDIFVTKIDDLGRINWMKRLPKRQVGAKEKGDMSYRHLMMGEDHYFLFIDNAKNRLLAPGTRPQPHLNELGGHLTYYKINDSSGAITKKDLFDTRYINGISLHQFSSNRIVKINEKEFIVEFYKKDNEDILIKVELK